MKIIQSVSSTHTFQNVEKMRYDSKNLNEGKWTDLKTGVGYAWPKQNRAVDVPLFDPWNINLSLSSTLGGTLPIGSGKSHFHTKRWELRTKSYCKTFAI